EKLNKLSSKLTDMGHEFIHFDTVEKDLNKLKKRASSADILMIANNPLKGEVINSAENLKYIDVAFTGVDHVDRKACIDKKVLVSNANGYATEAVAELTVGMAISLLRNIKECDEETRKGGTREGLIGNELNGKTVGVVGTGAIGTRTAQMFKVFNCNLLGYNRTEHEDAKKIGIKYTSLEELLKNSDIVSIHLPLTENTKGCIDKDKLSLMKDNAVLINVARGPIVNGNDLKEALNSGKLRGAGIDVFDNEPPIKEEDPLLNAKNVILTPHVAFATKEAMEKRADIVFDNLYSYLKGKPKNVVIK
ncbi:MAG: 2-hydroxyacid dehydrogenase, partial [Clostridium sp.]|nr:2-hydroxyacid dehydrogenase [Clostridium sp.]